MKFKFKDYEVHYNMQGSGEPVLLLNGIMMSMMSWEAFVDPFTKDNTLIRVDFLDQGFSSRMTETYGPELQAELVKALLDHLELDQVSIVGISYGVSVALNFAVKYQNMIKKMVLANGTAHTGKWLTSIGECWNAVAKTRDGEAYYNLTIPVIYSPEFYKAKAEWMDARKQLLIPIFSNEIFLEAMIRLTKSHDLHDVREYLSDIDVPTLIIGAQEDYIIPLTEQQYLNKHIKNSELIVFPNCGHASMYEKPVLFTSTALGFVNLEKLEYTL